MLSCLGGEPPHPFPSSCKRFSESGIGAASICAFSACLPGFPVRRIFRESAAAHVCAQRGGDTGHPAILLPASCTPCRSLCPFQDTASNLVRVVIWEQTYYLHHAPEGARGLLGLWIKRISRRRPHTHRTQRCRPPSRHCRHSRSASRRWQKGYEATSGTQLHQSFSPWSRRT